ncbi:MAG: alpha/beta hydrolase fold domain-containing protein [Angustibacter sp.]
MTRDHRDVLHRPGPSPDLVLRYGPLADHVGEVWWPSMPVSRMPVVLVVHGGFWRVEYDRGHTRPQCAGFAAAGCPVVTIEYRRARQPGAGWRATLDDVALAVATLPGLVVDAARRAGRQVDPARVVLVGHSAGGHLVAWAVTRPCPGVIGAVTLAGVLDLHLAAELRLDDPAIELSAIGAPAVGAPAVGGPMIGGAAVDVPAVDVPAVGDVSADGRHVGRGDRGHSLPAVQAFLGGEPHDVPQRYAAADPSRLGRPARPVIAVHGAADDTVPAQLSVRYAQATGQSCRILADVEHFALIDPTSTAWHHVLLAVRDLADLSPVDRDDNADDELRR